MPPSTSWRLAAGQNLLHRCWDGECILYNDLTGDTHLVDESTLALLELLGAEPMPAALLAAALGAAPADPAPGAPHEPLAAVLAELAALHLIEAAPC